MLENQIHALATIIKNKDMRDYFRDGFWELIEAILFQDPEVAAQAGHERLIFHIPTVIFWDKMERFLRGTFHSYEDQIKFSAKFHQDNQEYNQYIKN